MKDVLGWSVIGFFICSELNDLKRLVWFRLCLEPGTRVIHDDSSLPLIEGTRSVFVELPARRKILSDGLFYGFGLVTGN